MEDAYKMRSCAVEQGHKDAAFQLALYYKIEERSDLAYEMYRKGAMLGSSKCKASLRDAYVHESRFIELGLNQDPVEANCLYDLNKRHRDNPTLTFPDLDELCPVTVPQP